MRLLPKNHEIGWTPYAWLVYLGFFLIHPIADPISGLEWAATIGAILVFLGLYFLGFWSRGIRCLLVAAGIAALGFGFAPFNLGSSVFFIYAAGQLGYVHPPRRAVVSLAVLLGLVLLQSWWLGFPPVFWVPGIIFSALIGGVNVHNAEVSRANARLRASQREVERLAQTAERERIARDLHDLLGHTLSLIALKAELAGKLLGRDPERAGREIAELEAISRDALREVRSAVAGYRSEGLQAELARARLALDSSGVRLEYFAAPVVLEPERETVLALALREAVTNVIRHAGARTCRVEVGQTGDETRLLVRDDGRGGEAPEGTGLAVMRERVEGLGGRLERSTDGGTTVEIVLPRHAAGEPAPEAGREGLADLAGLAGEGRA